MANNDVLNAKEAAQFLGAYVETIRRLARKGEIPSYKIGKDWRFRKEALIKWAETHHLRHNPPLILAIDDDPDIRKLLRAFLEKEGYRVCMAANGTEGMGWLDRESVDLILLDLKMPGMNGATFCHELRKKDTILPVIIVTGYPDSILMNDVMQYGPFMLIAKPIERKQLIQAVEMALKGTHEARMRE